jgi:hypothetical protein
VVVAYRGNTYTIIYLERARKFTKYFITAISSMKFLAGKSLGKNIEGYP